MEENKRISDLFERARTEAPKTSFEDVKGHFIATGAVAGVGLLAKWAAVSLKLKVIIMSSTLITLTVSGLLVTSALNSSPIEKEVTDPKEYILPMENLEIKQEDGIKETIIYDDQDQVVEIIVDSSSKLTDASEETTSNTVLELNPQELTTTRGEINTTPPRTTKANNTISEGDTGTEHRFEITEKTTKEELENIKEQAEKAGIKMTYTARIKKNIIQRLSMTWILNTEDGKSNCQVSLNGDEFEVEVGWKENEEGKAISFLNDKFIQSSNKPVSIIVDNEGNLIRTKN